MNKIKLFFLKIKCRKIYNQLPTEIKMQLWFEFNDRNDNESYNDILKRELEYKGEINGQNKKHTCII